VNAVGVKDTNKAKRPQLGEWCEVTAVLDQQRTAIFHPTSHHFQHYLKEWVNKPKWQFETPKRMMYIGYRTIFDGNSIWVDEEVGSVFQITAHKEAWIFVENARSKPVRVLPECVTRQAAQP
jgi:hypothetical protein